MERVKKFAEDYFRNDSYKYLVIIKDALRDSLCRGLTGREPTPFRYFTGTDEFQTYAEKQEWINFLGLFYRYRGILKKESLISYIYLTVIIHHTYH